MNKKNNTTERTQNKTEQNTKTKKTRETYTKQNERKIEIERKKTHPTFPNDFSHVGIGFFIKIS